MPIELITRLLARLSPRSENPNRANSTSPFNTSTRFNNASSHNGSVATTNSTAFKAYPSESIQPELISANAITLFLTIAFVFLRLFSRWRKGLEYGIDDWTSVLALLFFFILVGINMDMIYKGLGRHVGALDHVELATFKKLILGFQITYMTVLEVTKISVLTMYMRIFPVRQMRISAYTVGFLSLIWSIAMIFISIFRCTPIPKTWNSSLSGHCVNLLGAAIGSAFPNILSDIVILVLPMPLLWHLQTSVVQKIMLSGVFLLGSFVIFTSIYRLITLLKYDPKDSTWSLSRVFSWSVIECSAAIISSCLPTLGPLFPIPTLTLALTQTFNFITTHVQNLTKKATGILNHTLRFSRASPRNGSGDVGLIDRMATPMVGRERSESRLAERRERRRRMRQEAKFDVLDVGEGIRRPVFFRLPSSRGESYRGGSGGSGDSGRVNRSENVVVEEMGGDGSCVDKDK